MLSAVASEADSGGVPIRLQVVSATPGALAGPMDEQSDGLRHPPSNH